MTKTFHISDILSVMTGTALVFTQEMTMPDGQTRPAYRTNLHGIVDVIAHISGNDLWDPDNDSRYDRDKMMHLLPHVKRSLATQLPWLKDVKFPHDDLPQNDRAAAQEFCDDWVRAIAAGQGSEWFDLHEDPDIGIVHTVTFGGPSGP